MKCALFLDRDGTLNEDPGYLKDPEQLKIFSGAGRALARVKNRFDFRLIVISNQSGVARGMMTREDVERVNAELNRALSAEGAGIDKFYYCTAHPAFRLAGESDCRKPSPQMVIDAAREFDIDLSKSYFIGDKAIDILCGINAGCRTVLVRTGEGESEISTLQKENILPNFIALNIVEACNFIYDDVEKNN